MNGARLYSAAADSSIRRFAAFFFLGALVTACQGDGCEPVEDRTEERNNGCKTESRDGADQLLIARGIERVSNERGGRDADEASGEKTAGTERSDEIGFAHAEHDERDKFQDKA